MSDHEIKGPDTIEPFRFRHTPSETLVKPARTYITVEAEGVDLRSTMDLMRRNDANCRPSISGEPRALRTLAMLILRACDVAEEAVKNATDH